MCLFALSIPWNGNAYIINGYIKTDCTYRVKISHITISRCIFFFFYIILVMDIKKMINKSQTIVTFFSQNTKDIAATVVYKYNISYNIIIETEFELWSTRSSASNTSLVVSIQPYLHDNNSVLLNISDNIIHNILHNMQVNGKGHTIQSIKWALTINTNSVCI